MKTIKFTGGMNITFGVAGAFTPGQDSVTVENDIADTLLAKGYFVEVKEEAKKANKALAESTI